MLRNKNFLLVGPFLRYTEKVGFPPFFCPRQVHCTEVVGPVAMKFLVVVGGMARNIYPWKRPSQSRVGQEKGGKFELFWVLLCEMASFGVFVAPAS